MRVVLHKQIPPTQLEQKFGGVLSNKRSYWFTFFLNTSKISVQRPPKTTFLDTNYSLSPSRASSQEFVSAKSSFSKASEDHYSDSVLSNAPQDYFFELNQKDCFYRSGEKLEQPPQSIEDLKIRDESCFGPCFGGNKTTIIDLQEEPKKNNVCRLF